MKHFIGIKKSEKISRTYGGATVKCYIYEIIDNEPVYVGEVEWCTCSYKGEESCIMNALGRSGVIHEEFKDGYFKRDNGQFKITWMG